MVRNAFNILINEGFLRDKQGVQTLEAVQTFYGIIKEPMRTAKMGVKDLKSFCQAGGSTLRAVITLFYEDSESNDQFYHAVRVSI